MFEKISKVVYVLCPANLKSGGADALHQMVFYLNKIGKNAKIAYFTLDGLKESVQIPERYRLYVDGFVLESEIIDSSENTIIIPESSTRKRKKFRNAKIFIWWLSVEHNYGRNFFEKIFFIVTLPLRIIKNKSYYKGRTLKLAKLVINEECYPFKKEKYNIKHLCASYYAYDYVSQRSQNEVLKCIEPISKLFLNNYLLEKRNISKSSRNNVILFNPVRKYDDVLNLIAKKAPELQFEPLRGLTQKELIEKYKTSKLYIDFGAFPGAERIPKEAVLFGCAVITGKRGASGFHGDVPIPEEYKFGNPDSQIDEIVAKIRYVLDNYEKVYSDFDEYRNTILNLEENFIRSLKQIFL